MAGILVYALHDDEGNFNKNSLGAISEAAKLAGEIGGEAAALVVPHPVLVQVHDASGWEPAWLLACGPDGGDRRYLVQRDGADSSEPQWLAEGQLALPGSGAD